MKRKRTGGNFCSDKCEHQKQSKRQGNDFKKAKERKAGAPTVEQEQNWLNQINRFVMENGSYPRGRAASAKWQFHHMFGRKARHSGKEVGRWAVIPIEFDYHDISSNEKNNITNFPKRYAEKFGSDIDQFLVMCQAIEEQQGKIEIPSDILEAIIGLS